MAAQSPAAKMTGSVSVCKVSRTRTKPISSRARPVSRSQAAPPAWVTQMISSAVSTSPDSVCKSPAATCVTLAPRCTTTPRAASSRSKAARTRALWVLSIRGSAEKRWKRRASGSRPSASNSRRRRYCIARVSSTPPAPAPTRARVIAPGCWQTRSSKASQPSLKRRIGLTGRACSAAPATWPNCGVEPMLIERAS